MIRAQVFGAEYPLAMWLPGPLRKVGSVHGRLVGRDGKAFTDCTLRHSFPGSWLSINARRRETIAPDGRFELGAMPIGQRVEIVAQSTDGKLGAGVEAEITAERTELAASIELRPTIDAEVLVVDFDGAPRPNLSLEILPARLPGRYREEAKTDLDGVLRLPSLIEGVRYSVSIASSGSTAAILDPATARASAAVRPRIVVSRNYLVSLRGPDGTSLPIECIREHFLWTMVKVERTRRPSAPLKILGQLSTGVMVDRAKFSSGKPGDKVEMQLELADGRGVHAEGVLPAYSSGIIELRAK